MKNHKQEGSQKGIKCQYSKLASGRCTCSYTQKGSSLAKLSRDNGLHERTLYNALERHWPKGEKIIADYIGVTREEIWPERYSNSEE
jgi:Ner family transcriptional regulator